MCALVTGVQTCALPISANWMGCAGAWFADLGLSIGGVGIALLVPLLGIIAWRLWTGEAQPWWPRQLAYSFIGILLVGLGAELWSPATNAPMPAGSSEERRVGKECASTRDSRGSR